MDQRPSPHHSQRHQSGSQPERALYCPLCRRPLKTHATGLSAEVVCEGCGFAFELTAAGPPDHPLPAEGPLSQPADPLDCWLAGKPIRPRQASDWERLRGWARQRPLAARFVAVSGIATLLVAAVSTVMLWGVSAAHRQTEHALALLEQQHARAQLELQESERLVREHKRETYRATEACQRTLAKLQETEGSLNDLRQRYDALAQGQEQIQADARLALVRKMVAESARRLAVQPAESLLLAERAITYLGSQGESVDVKLQQTLRDAAALTGDDVLRGHSGPVEAIAISRNGRWLLTGSVDTTVRLWDLHSPSLDQPLLLQAHESPVRFAVISPDSCWAITSDDAGQVAVWDLRSSDPAASMRKLRAHQGRIHALAVSSDSRWLAVGGTGSFEVEDNSVRLWDLKELSRAERDSPARAAEQPIVLRGHLGPVLAVAVTPDCRWVVTGSDDETVRLFDLTSHCPAASQVVLREHAGSVTSIAVSPDGRWMVTGSRDQTARLWDLTTPQPGSRVTVLNGHQGGVHSVAISSTGRWVATAAHDQTVRLWDMNAVDPAASCVVLTKLPGDVGPILFSPDGRQLIAGGEDGTACVWEVEAGASSFAPMLLRGHCGPVGALAITPDGRRVLTGCRQTSDRTDCLVRLWDLPIGEVLEKARPLADRRLNATEQEKLLLETARRTDEGDQNQAKVQ